MEREKTRPDDVLDVGAMKLEVELEGTRMIAARARGDSEPAIDFAQLAHETAATFGRERRCLSHSETFEVTDDDEELARVTLRERSDDESLIAAETRRGDEAFLLQPVEGAPHRSATRSETLHDGTLDDTSARWELTGDDQTTELIVYARDVIRAFTGSSRMLSGLRRPRRGAGGGEDALISGG
jgi:hypothetical protein